MINIILYDSISYKGVMILYIHHKVSPICNYKYTIDYILHMDFSITFSTLFKTVCKQLTFGYSMLQYTLVIIILIDQFSLYS